MSDLLPDYIEMHEAALALLKPCPFCGTSMRGCCSGAKEGVLCFVTCAECGATMGEPGEIPESPIIERWNRSPVPVLSADERIALGIAEKTVRWAGALEAAGHIKALLARTEAKAATTGGEG